MTFTRPIGPPELPFAEQKVWPSVALEADAPTSAASGGAFADYTFFQGQACYRSQSSAAAPPSVAGWSFNAGGFNRHPPEGLDVALVFTVLFNLPILAGGPAAAHFGWPTPSTAGLYPRVYGGHLVAPLVAGASWAISVGAQDTGESFMATTNGATRLTTGWHKAELVYGKTSTMLTIDDDPRKRIVRKEVFPDTSIQSAFAMGGADSGGFGVNMITYYSRPTYRYVIGPTAIG